MDHTTEREEIAKRYGFNSFAELLDASHPLPMKPGDNAQSYFAMHPSGYCVVWKDVQASPPPGDAADSRGCG